MTGEEEGEEGSGAGAGTDEAGGPKGSDAGDGSGRAGEREDKEECSGTLGSLAEIGPWKFLIGALYVELAPLVGGGGVGTWEVLEAAF